jgi:hypothetical protein
MLCDPSNAKHARPTWREQAAAMIPDDVPARGAKPETAGAELKVGNDDGGTGAISIDPRILVIARAVGRQLAREKLGKQQAANDNTSEDEP